MPFAIGQKVICIHSWKRSRGNFILPKFMHIYTVRAYCICADCPAILFEEITNIQVTFIRTYKRGEASFAERFFRALEPLTDEQELMEAA